MDAADDSGVIRIERGSADAWEVAALTAVLLARLAAARAARSADEPPDGTTPESRARWEHDAPYQAPYSWQ
ncbi:acyl-CoA carboxylase epsilon subunit [Streptomyces sp. NPDC050418]|uniref:acyl-CoA carboxylase epsilon subunit n=1 Tax=Streptomyces sp. NPDC050418 TaxID=3365612 RepID=UPI0037882A07